MIIITKLEESNPQFIVTISGNFQVEVLSIGDDCNLKIMGLTNGFFNCNASNEDVVENGQIQTEKVFQWLLVKMQEAVEVASGDSFFEDELLASFHFHNESTSHYESTLSGTCMIALIDEDDSWIRFRFHKVSNKYFDFLVKKNDSVLEKGIDPSKLLRWLLNKMKEYLCPECL